MTGDEMLALHEQGMTYREIAERSGKRIGNVYEAIVRAKDKRDKKAKQAAIKIRPCMCCGRPFKSLGPGNRLCGRCASKDDYMLYA